MMKQIETSRENW